MKPCFGKWENSNEACQECRPLTVQDDCAEITMAQFCRQMEAQEYFLRSHALPSD